MKVLLTISTLFLAAALVPAFESPNDHTGRILLSIPTGEPSSIPTGEPTSIPTGEPSSIPTGEPTTLPTSEPTSVPTGEPTSIPTSSPISLTSFTPTNFPISTLTPVIIPVIEPAPIKVKKSKKPTISPTEVLPLPDCSLESPQCDASLFPCVPMSFSVVLALDNTDAAIVQDGLGHLTCSVAAIAELSSAAITVTMISSKVVTKQGLGLQTAQSVAVSYEFSLISSSYLFPSDEVAYETIIARLKLGIMNGMLTSFMNNLGTMTDGVLTSPAAVTEIVPETLIPAFTSLPTAAPSEIGADKFGVSGINMDSTDSASAKSLWLFIYVLSGVVGMCCFFFIGVYIWRKYHIASDKLSKVRGVVRTDDADYQVRGLVPSDGDPVEWFDISTTFPDDKKTYYL